MKGKRDVIRAGDRVRVVVPRVVVRVGYPKCVADYVPEVRERFAEQLAALRRGISPTSGVGLLGAVPDASAPHVVGVMGKIERELAYALLKRDSFGGSERTVHEVERPEFLGHEAVVESLRTAYSGTYFPGRRRRTAWGDDDDPPALHGAKAHRIATVWLAGFDGAGFFSPDQFEIQTCHLQKVANKRED